MSIPNNVGPTPGTPAMSAMPGTPRDAIFVIGNVLGALAILLGCIAMIIAFIPLIGVAAIPIAIIGGLAGIVGLLVLLFGKRGLPIVPGIGILFALLATVICVVVNVWFASAVVSAANEENAKQQAQRAGSNAPPTIPGGGVAPIRPAAPAVSNDPRVAKSMERLSAIGMALMVAELSNPRPKPTLASLVAAGAIEPDMLVSPFGSVGGSGDYWLNPRVNSTSSAETIKGYDRGSYRSGDQVVVLFGDSHTDAVSIADFQRMMGNGQYEHTGVDFELPQRP